MSLSKLENLLRREVRNRELYEEGLEMVSMVTNLQAQEKEFLAATERAKKAKEEAEADLEPIKYKIAQMIEEAQNVLKDAKITGLKATKSAKDKLEIADKKANEIISEAKSIASANLGIASDKIKSMEKEKEVLTENLGALKKEIKEDRAELDALNKIVSDRKSSIERALAGLQ